MTMSMSDTRDPAQLAASAPLTRRLLAVAEAVAHPLTGPRALTFGLRALAGVYTRAARRQAPGSLRSELEHDARECRALALLVSLADQTARALDVDLGAGALEVARSLSVTSAEADFSEAARAEMALGAERARALVDHLGPHGGPPQAIETPMGSHLAAEAARRGRS